MNVVHVHNLYQAVVGCCPEPSSGPMFAPSCEEVLVCVCVSLGQHAGHTLFKVERSFRTDVTHTHALPVHSSDDTENVCSSVCAIEGEPDVNLR